MKLRIVWTAILASLLILLASGCAQKTVPREEKSLIITDSAGREVTVPQPLERVVVLAPQPAEVINALGAHDKVVGVTDNVLKHAITKVYQDKPSVGMIQAFSVESILELKPQLVISTTGMPDAYRAALSLGEQVKSYGIQVAFIDCFPDMDAIARDVPTLGILFGKEQRAKEYVDFYQKYLNLVAERTRNLQPSGRVRAYMETLPYTVGELQHKAIVAAGGIDVAGEIHSRSVTVSSEWVGERNPQVIVAWGYPTVTMGFGVTDEKAAKAHWQGIMNRPGWAATEAVREGNVHLLAFEIFSGPRAPIGILYLAKWFYPELFKDIDPERVHDEFLSRFFGLKEYKGILVYPRS